MDNQDHIELLINLDAKMESLIHSMDELRKTHETFNKLLLIGNGKPSVMDRLTALEAGHAENKKVCDECGFDDFRKAFEKFKNRLLLTIASGFGIILIAIMFEHSAVAMKALGIK